MERTYISNLKEKVKNLRKEREFNLKVKIVEKESVDKEKNRFVEPKEVKFPFKCKYKNRTPDPGICYILEINFEDRKVQCSNGYVRMYPSFDEIEFIPDIFIFNTYNL